ncbi:MAG TPA: TonB-dependent receptor [Steroidobacteraceae bacterium]|nr:TonB-dependent receptor [Steroidobacteraceae bacterium]
MKAPMVLFILSTIAATGAGAALADSVAPADAGTGSATAAQQTGGSTDTATPGNEVLQEVVVTAEKRSSTVQDTPISMTALSGALMQQEGIASLGDVIQAVPGISVRTAGPGQTELEMRGLSSSGGSSPTVGFYLDDYPLSPPAAALNGKVVIDPDLYDLNRVEVLRGPQGTLYGSGSMGGTVKLVTDEPQLDKFSGAVEGIASGTVGGGFNRGGNLMLNAPLASDTLALRVVVTDKFRDGWITRYVLGEDFPVPVNPGPCGPGWPGCTRGNVLGVTPIDTVPRINWEHLQGGRASLLWQPTSALKVDTTVMYQKINMGDYDEYDLPPGIPDARYQPFNASEPIADLFRLYGVTVNYDMGFAQLTSASSFFERTESQNTDNSEALYSVVGLFGVSIPEFYDIPFNETDTTRVFSQEVRLASSGSGPFQWIGGVFLTDFESVFAEYNASVPLAFISTGGAAANPLGLIYQSHNPYHIKQYAIFGEGTYAFTDSLKLTAGVRLYKFDSHANEETAGFATTSGNAAPTLNSFSQSNSGANPKVTLSYERNHDLTLYSTIARGFRPGGINQQIPASICAISTETYGPDSTWNYEIGEKARLFDNTLIVNSDVYYIKWAQVQQIVNQPCGYPLTENAGTAHSYGPEVEVSALLTHEWSVTFSGTITHSDITSVNPAISAADPSLVPGLPILNIPKYTETTSINYTKAVFDGFDFSARLSNSYVGPETDIEYTYATLPSYDLLGLRFGLVGDRLSAYLFGDNLTDKRAELGIDTTAFAWTIPSVERVVTNQPRTIGIDINYKF